MRGVFSLLLSAIISSMVVADEVNYLDGHARYYEQSPNFAPKAHLSSIRFTEKLSLNLESSLNKGNSVSIAYTPFASFSRQAKLGIGKEEPLTLRITLRGYEILETDTETGRNQFFSLDRYRDSNVKKQYVAFTVSKRF